MQMNAITTTITSERANIDGFYYSEFQKKSLNFEMDFIHHGAGEFCDYKWTSYPVDNGLIIQSRDTITFNNDKIEPNTSLNDYFVNTKSRRKFWLHFLVSLRNNVKPPDNGTFKFVGHLNLMMEQFYLIHA